MNTKDFVQNWEFGLLWRKTTSKNLPWEVSLCDCYITK